MHFEPLSSLPMLHETPMAQISINPSVITVEVDDEQERRVRFVLTPYQALRLITADCYEPPRGLTIIPQTVVEVKDSDWIGELKAVLQRSDYTASFMDKARHFLLPLQDDFLEVVAWDIRAE